MILVLSLTSSINAQAGSDPMCEIRPMPLVVRKLEKPLPCPVYFIDTSETQQDTIAYLVPPVLRVRMPGARCRGQRLNPANTQMVIRSATGQLIGDVMPIGRLSGYKVHRSRLRDFDETRLSRSPFRPRRPLFSRTWKFPLGSTSRSKCLEHTTVFALEPGVYTVIFQSRKRIEDTPIIIGSTQLVVSETK